MQTWPRPDLATVATVDAAVVAGFTARVAAYSPGAATSTIEVVVLRRYPQL